VVEIRVKGERFMMPNGSIVKVNRQEMFETPLPGKQPMKIPRYWKRVLIDEQGRPVKHFSDYEFNRSRACLWAYGWSDLSPEAAEQHGLERAQSILRRVRMNNPIPRQYSYPDRPLREEVIERDPHDRWVITRNAYGSLVLNTRDAMFIDIDQSWQIGPGLINKFLGRRSLVSPEQVIEQTRKALQKWPNFSGRLYRTAAGFRLLVTHATFEPESAIAHELMNACQADAKYKLLCRKQQCFRARLTPKPWRCDCLIRADFLYPYETPEEVNAMNEWLEMYARGSAGWATCHLMAIIGDESVAPSIAPLVDLHDQYSGVGTNLPLA
jgi:hypothetical protein